MIWMRTLLRVIYFRLLLIGFRSKPGTMEGTASSTRSSVWTRPSQGRPP